jgi:hypothetical protein
MKRFEKLKSANVIFILFLLISGVSGALAQDRKLLPVDEGKRDASFSQFRKKTLAAAKRRDVKYILSIVDRNIKNGFGDSNGIDEFKKFWKINRPQSEFWNEFISVLSNGGTFDKESGAKNKTFVAPYTFSSFPADLDGFEYQAVFGTGVNLRSKPETNAPVVASLAYNIVKVDFENSVADKAQEGEYTWLKIETLGGKKGFVKAAYVRSPIDYRAVFEKKKGKWIMTVFLAGD